MKIILFYNFELMDLLPFFVGILAGLILFFLIYVIIVVKSIKKDVKKISSSEEVCPNTVKLLIKSQVDRYKDKQVIEYHKENNMNHYKEIVLELLDLLAKMYFPTSKHPTLEITDRKSTRLNSSH